MERCNHEGTAALQDESINAFNYGPNSSIRPPLKWVGGKRWQVPYLYNYWLRHRHRRLVEPFCGGLAVALGFRPERALLNDINPHLINFYRQLKKGLAIRLILENDSSLFYSHRQQFNELLAKRGGNSSRAAALFYFLNRTGYNGLCRFNRRGEFNVPFGTYKTINYKTAFREYRQVFKDWEFTTTYFAQISLDPEDFIYADPPYDVEFRQYSKHGFGWEEQEQTAEWLARHAGPVILSNQATSRIKKLYKKLGYQLRFLKAPRRINCTGDRTPAPEVLATRNLGQ